MEDGLKGLFDFSRRQQIGLLFFLLIVVSCLLLIRFHAYFMPLPESSVSPLDSAWLAHMDSLVVEKESFSYESSEFTEKKTLADPFIFNPNEVSLADLQVLGFSLKQAESIDRYRSKGGKFRSPEDFKKMFVVNEFMYARLEHFLSFPENQSDDKYAYSEKKDWPKKEEKSNRIYALNTVDSIGLEGLPGIGPIYAQRIIKYRERLGGYTSIEQLNEVYGLDKNPETVSLISPFLTVDGIPLTKINVNTATWAELVRHPYINKNIANSIIAIRLQHGPYKEVNDVSMSHLISPMVFLQIAPYLKVSD